jgi:hypothetical protein
MMDGRVAAGGGAPYYIETPEEIVLDRQAG